LFPAEHPLSLDVSPEAAQRGVSFQENIMSAATDKAAGLANQAAGNVKQAVGKAVGNDRLEAEGAGQEAKGKVQKAVGNAKDVVKKAANDFKKGVDAL